MENLAHTLTGIALARTGLGKKVPFATLTLAAAANAPDIDVVVSVEGALHYLHYHRGITHSILGTVALGLLVGLLAWLFRGWSRDPDAGLQRCLGTSLLVSLTHSLLDYTNSYGIRPFLPFSSERVFGDLVFIVDPYLWIILGAGVFLTARRTRWSRVVWIALLTLVTGIGVAFTLVDLRGIWFLLLLLLAGFAVWWLKQRRAVWPGWVAGLSLAGMPLYWGFLWLSQSQGLEMAVDAVQQGFDREYAVSALPRPADPFTWEIFFQDHEYVYFGLASVLEKEKPSFASFPRNLDDPAVKAVLESCPGRVLTHFGRFEFFEVEEERAGLRVLYRDARYARERDSGFGTFEIPLNDRLEPVLSMPCPDIPVESGARLD